MKFGGKKMTYALWVLCNFVWLSEKCPREWGKGVIALLYKDGDKRDPLNYRGITLLSVVGKAFAALINARLMVFCEKGGVLADEQAGFRRGRACIDQIFILKEVLNMRKGKKGKRTYTCFRDVKKAYDRVWWAGLWKTLWARACAGGVKSYLRKGGEQCMCKW